MQEDFSQQSADVGRSEHRESRMGHVMCRARSESPNQTSRRLPSIAKLRSSVSMSEIHLTREEYNRMVGLTLQETSDYVKAKCSMDLAVFDVLLSDLENEDTRKNDIQGKDTSHDHCQEREAADKDTMQVKPTEAIDANVVVNWGNTDDFPM